ncbi:Uncharacterised protein [Chromobacterium vaccinii]|nr:Uncharacterised protein [Chromobacterium vaccinii]
MNKPNPSAATPSDPKYATPGHKPEASPPKPGYEAPKPDQGKPHEDPTKGHIGTPGKH